MKFINALEKQAVIITAYKDLEHLLRIAYHFDERFVLFIHIDKKSVIDRRLLGQLEMMPNVALISRKYTVNWGGINHFKAILFLAKEALKLPYIGYIHAISGADFPIKSPQYFIDFIEENRGQEFMEFFPLPTELWRHGGMDRILFYNFYDLLNGKTKAGYAMIDRLKRLQKWLGFSRKWPRSFPVLYGGSTWWTLSRECLGYVLTYLDDNRSFFRRFKHTFCSEEICLQTVVMNSPFKEKTTGDCLRYIDWQPRNGSLPAILDSSDFDKVAKSSGLFARKFDAAVSTDLLEKITKHSNANL